MKKCLLTEVGQLIQVAGPPTPPRSMGDIQCPCNDPRGYTSGNGGCGLYAPDFGGGILTDIRRVHGDIHIHPVVPVDIRHGGKKHNIKAVVSLLLV